MVPLYLQVVNGVELPMLEIGPKKVAPTMSHVFPRHTKSIPPTAVRAQGPYIYDGLGKAYIDGSGGAAVSCLGHGDPDVLSAIHDQLDRLVYAHTGFFTSQPAEALAEKLIDYAPHGLDRVYFVSGGSEAVEAALKLACQYFSEIGQPNRKHVIARRQSYHGNTLGALAAGGNAWRKKQFSSLLIETHHISPCYAYRGQAAGETLEAYGIRVADELEAECQRLGPENVMAFVAEPVVGATLGAVPPVAGYFKRIKEICERHGVLLILDEVMCGMGRTGTLFACEQDAVSPDIAVIAKGLGGGYQPIGAMLCSGQIYAAIQNGSGFFQHGHTYQAHPTACAAGLAVLRKLTDGGLTRRCAKVGEAFRERLEQAFGQHENVGDIRGRGLFLGLEIVEDRNTKAAFSPDLGINAKIKRQSFEEGLICYPMGGTIDGVHGDHILLAPPFIIDDGHMDEIVSKLQIALDKVLGR